VKVVTISSWLNFGRPAPSGRGSATGQKFLAPPFYSQRAVFASLLALFSVYDVFVLSPRPYVIYFILVWHDIACLCCVVKQQWTNQPCTLKILKSAYDFKITTIQLHASDHRIVLYTGASNPYKRRSKCTMEKVGGSVFAET